VSQKLIEGLLARVASVKEEGVRREAGRYLEAHPELEGLVPLLLDRSDGAGRELALRLAGLLRTPVMLQAVRDFALGQRGADRLRIQAAQLADEAGLLPGGPARLWLDGQWRGGMMHQFEIHSDVVEQPHAAGVLDLLGQAIAALHGGQAARAERLLRQALAIDLDDPVVLNNLAVACAQLRRTDESEALRLRLHERHPDYLFGRTALASLAAERGELDRARELLAPLLTRQRLHIGEYAALCMAQGKRSRVEGDKSIATPKPGRRCVALRVLAHPSVDVSSAPNTATRTQLGVSDRRTLRQRGDWRQKALELSLLPPRTRLHRVL
jgi:hypothetical protein